MSCFFIYHLSRITYDSTIRNSATLCITLPTIFRVVRVVRSRSCCSPKVVSLEGSKLLMVVWVARNGFCCSPDAVGLERSALPTVVRVSREGFCSFCSGPVAVCLKGSAPLTILGVARRGFCCGLGGFGPEETPLPVVIRVVRKRF